MNLFHVRSWGRLGVECIHFTIYNCIKGYFIFLGYQPVGLIAGVDVLAVLFALLLLAGVIVAGIATWKVNNNISLSLNVVAQSCDNNVTSTQALEMYCMYFISRGQLLYKRMQIISRVSTPVGQYCELCLSAYGRLITRDAMVSACVGVA
jgi:hypothetical protein